MNTTNKIEDIKNDKDSYRKPNNNKAYFQDIIIENDNEALKVEIYLLKKKGKKTEKSNQKQ